MKFNPQKCSKSDKIVWQQRNQLDLCDDIINPTPEIVIFKKNAVVACFELITEIYQQDTQATKDVSQYIHGLLTTDVPYHLSSLMSNVSDSLSAEEKKNLLKF